MPITYRLVKGSALTYSELDGNFTALSESVSTIVVGDVNYIPVFNTTNSLTSSIMYQALGNLYVSGGITSSLFGTSSFARTSSYALNGLSSSYSLNTTSASFARTSSYALNALSSSYTVTASYASVAQTLLGSITSASYALSASFAVSASEANFLDGIDATRFAITGSNRFNGNQTITGSFLASGSGHSFVGTLNITGSVFVSSSVSASTLGQFTGNNNGYVEFSVRNTNGGVSASGDIAVYADNGTVLNNYIDMGINNSGLSNAYFYGGTDFGNANDAYVYNVGGDLRIGNATTSSPSQSLYLFANSAARPDISITGSRVGIQKSSGSLNATLDITGSVLISGSLTVSGSSLLSRLTTFTASYTLALSDLGNIIEMSSSTANTVTIPSSSVVRFPIPAEIQVLQWGSGSTSIAAGSPNVFTGSVNSYNKIAARYSGVTLVQRALDQWYIIGNLSA